MFHILENLQKSQVLECSEELKNEDLSNLEGVDFGVQNVRNSVDDIVMSQIKY